MIFRIQFISVLFVYIFTFIKIKIYLFSLNKKMLSQAIKKIFFNHHSDLKSFGVVGSGQMGTGIAIVANRVAGLNVTIYDSNQVALKKSQ